MFHHVVVFRWAEGTTPEQVRAVLDGLAGLPAVIPELRQYRTGPDLGLVEGNWHFAVAAGFDDEAGWRAYTIHPAHQKVIADLLRPILADRAAVQYES
ncbi:MAG: Dabb family protein [Acidimicrobiales bacterium]